MSVIYDKYTGKKVEGDWVHVDEMVEDCECPECGALKGQQCHVIIGDDAIEVGNFIHAARLP